MVDVERIKFGKRQTIDTLMSEEALLFAKYLRKEKADYFGLNKFIEWYGKSDEELLAIRKDQLHVYLKPVVES